MKERKVCNIWWSRKQDISDGDLNIMLSEGRESLYRKLAKIK